MSEIFFGAYCDVDTCCLSWHKLKSNFGYIGTPYSTRTGVAPALGYTSVFGRPVNFQLKAIRGPTSIGLTRGHQI